MTSAIWFLGGSGRNQTEVRAGVDGRKTTSDREEGESAGHRADLVTRGLGEKRGAVCTAGQSSLQRTTREEGALLVHFVDVRKLGKIVLDGLACPCRVGGEATCWCETDEAGGEMWEEPRLPISPPLGISHHLSIPWPALESSLHSLK